MIKGIQQFWEETTIDDLLKMTKNDILQELQKIAELCSNDKIVFVINKEYIYYEGMDERDFNND